jgi:phenylalanyl-tRNA synthetase alpha chain
LLSSLQRSLGALEPDARRDGGAQLQEARRIVEAALEARRSELAQSARDEAIASDRLELGDVIPESVHWPVTAGHPNLVASTQRKLEDVFVAMGFEISEGPEVESDWYNFEALNIPPAHPARGMWDTFYVDLGEPETVVLRTHTSPTQIHLMEHAVRTNSLPIHSVMPGRCYRRDAPDSRHLATFHQIEGLVVDRDITFADLAGTIDTFTRAFFGPEISSRLRPAFFPFTEPSAEFEITCTICHGEGCRTCSQTGWIELGGCGMLDPAVLAAVGIDDEVWSGFAFGFGIDRCAQMRHQIADMRALIENDVRFLRQIS